MSYTKCALTKPSDKLVALSGFAQLYQSATGDDYLAGLWRSQIPSGLNWQVIKPKERLNSDYLAPSWSWAAIDGAVGFLQQPAFHTLQVLNIQTTRSKFNPTGQVHGGFLDIEAVLIPAICKKKNKPWGLEIQNDDYLANLYEDTLGDGLKDGNVIYCLSFGCVFRHYTSTTLPDYPELQGILLKSVPGNSGHYARVGCFDAIDENVFHKFGVCIDQETQNFRQDESVSYSRISIL